MARKPRPDPFSEGCIRDIYKHFFGPLIFYKPPLLTIQDWLNYLFDASNRDIVRYVATKDFKMPGLLFTSGSVKVQGLGYRPVTKGDELWVRTDARNPNQIDVEYLGGVGSAEQVFSLNSSEWNWTREFVVDSDRERKK
jgi:hypothetical protein